MHEATYVAHHEPASDLNDEELFNASERARKALHRSLRAPANEYSPRKVQELRQAVSAYESILMTRLRKAMDSLN